MRRHTPITIGPCRRTSASNAASSRRSMKSWTLLPPRAARKCGVAGERRSFARSSCRLKITAVVDRYIILPRRGPFHTRFSKSVRKEPRVRSAKQGRAACFRGSSARPCFALRTRGVIQPCESTARSKDEQGSRGNGPIARLYSPTGSCERRERQRMNIYDVPFSAFLGIKCFLRIGRSEVADGEHSPSQQRARPHGTTNCTIRDRNE
jgi:hypothetical protein